MARKRTSCKSARVSVPKWKHSQKHRTKAFQVPCHLRNMRKKIPLRTFDPKGDPCSWRFALLIVCLLLLSLFFLSDAEYFPFFSLFPFFLSCSAVSRSQNVRETKWGSNENERASELRTSTVLSPEVPLNKVSAHTQYTIDVDGYLRS